MLQVFDEMDYTIQCVEKNGEISYFFIVHPNPFFSKETAPLLKLDDGKEDGIRQSSLFVAVKNCTLRIYNL